MTNRPASLLSEETCWRAFRDRDSRYDDAFVIAVRSTGIYCRPSCPARRPKRENIEFLTGPDAAEQKGFRPCLRCRPREESRAALVAKMTSYLEQHSDEPVRLAALAELTGMSPHHTLRVFRRVLGITPRQFADALRLRRLKKQLRKGIDVTTSLYEAGYGSSSRLYERSDTQLGMTPGMYRRGGHGMKLGYTIVPSPLGRVLVAASSRGISAVYLGETDQPLEAALRNEYPRAEIHRDANGLGRWVSAIVRHLDGGGTNPEARAALPLDVPLDVQATAFQRRVWQALRAIPYGTTKTYSQVAKSLGNPRATRAVARACATNPVSIVVPCHRVVREDGNLAGYRWGLDRKRALLERERATVAKHSGLTGSHN